MATFLEDPPSDKNVESQLLAARKNGPPLLSAKDYNSAYEVYRHVYELMLQKQPRDRRWHKGEPLHNMGFARLYQGLAGFNSQLWTLGLHDIVLAFIEDSLTCGEVDSDMVELEKPAAKSLRVCGYSNDELSSMATQIRGRLKRNVLVKNPETLFRKEYEQRVEIAVRLLERSPDLCRALVGPPLTPTRNTEHPIKAESDLLGSLDRIRSHIGTVGWILGLAMAIVGFLAPVLGLAAAALVVVGVALMLASGFVIYRRRRPGPPAS